MKASKFVVAFVVIVALAIPSAATVSTWSNECVSFGASRAHKVYPLMAVADGDTIILSEWSCAAIDGDLDLELQLCSGEVCGPYFGIFSAEGSCGRNTAITHDVPSVELDVLGDHYEGPVLLRGPSVLKARVLSRTSGTKGFSVCLR